MNKNIEEFSNLQLFLKNLTAIDSVKFRNIEFIYLKIKLIHILILCLLATILILLSIWLDLFVNMVVSVGATFISLCFFFFWLYYKEIPMRKFAMREHDILYKSGFIFQRLTALPYHRIQHITIQQGPIERLFNLASIHFHTAGGSSSDLIISGLKFIDVNKMKEYIIGRQKSV